MKSIIIEGEARKTTGKRETRELRKKEMVPCSIYGGNENINFVAPLKAFKDLVYTPEFYTATLKVDGKEINAVMQDIQFDPLTDDLIHIDFLDAEIGDFDSELVEDFWQAVAAHALCNLHIKLHHGRNNHHKSEAVFKATARALRMAVEHDTRMTGVPSTKGTLSS